MNEAADTGQPAFFWKVVSRGDVPSVRIGLRAGLNVNQLRR